MAPGAGVIDAEGAAGEAVWEGVKEGVAEPVGEPVSVPVAEAVAVPVCEGEVPKLHEGVGVLEEVGETLKEAVEEGVLEQVGTSAMLPGKQDRGHPHATQVALEVAPRAALNVPAAHGVGTAALTGQKKPAGHAEVVMV